MATQLKISTSIFLCVQELAIDYYFNNAWIIAFHSFFCVHKKQTISPVLLKSFDSHSSRVGSQIIKRLLTAFFKLSLYCQRIWKLQQAVPQFEELLNFQLKNEN